MITGRVRPDFAPVRPAFEELIEQRTTGTGAALAVWHDGDWIVDLWGGWADIDRTSPWRPDSLVMPYSVTKAFVATAALVLVERTDLDLDEPLRSVWPELAGATTLRHVLSHQAGVVALDEDVPTATFYDWDRMCALLAAQEPTWPSGTGIGESALFFGHLVGEVIRRVDGRPFGRFLREEVCGPAGLDFHVGLGIAELARTVDLTGLDALSRSGDERQGLYARALDNPPGALDPNVVNSRRWRAAEVPAVNGHGTARAVAGLYVALERGGLITADLVAEATAVTAAGTDQVLGSEQAWGLGFGVEADGYGMGGIGGSLGWWSRAGGYAIGYVTGELGEPEAAERLENIVREALGLPPL